MKIEQIAIVLQKKRMKLGGIIAEGRVKYPIIAASHKIACNIKSRVKLASEDARTTVG
jgi:hypothetical protein